MNLLHLEVFREIAHVGSISAAADVLGYSQPSVSRHLAALERETGTQLLERAPGGVRLTPAGRRLLSHAEVILTRVEIAKTELSFEVDEQRHDLVVAAFENVLSTFVPAAVRGLQRRLPGTRTTLHVCRPLSVYDLARSSAADVAIGLMPPGDETHDSELEVTPLLEDELLCIVPRMHPLALREEVELSDLLQEPWVMSHDDRCPMYREFSRVCAEHGFRPRRAYQTDDVAATLGIVAAGAALAVLPSLLLGPDATDVSYLRFNEPIRTVASAYAREMAPGGPSALFVEELLLSAQRFDEEVMSPVRRATGPAVVMS